MPTLPEHLSSPPVFSGVRVTRSLYLCVCFVDRCLSFCSFGHCVVCSSSIRILITPLVSLNSSYNVHILLFKTNINNKFTKRLIKWDTVKTILFISSLKRYFSGIHLNIDYLALYLTNAFLFQLQCNTSVKSLDFRQNCDYYYYYYYFIIERIYC